MKTNKKYAYLWLLALLAVLCAAGTASAAIDGQKLLDARTSVCWVEGEVFDGLVLGARGSIEFVYIDLTMTTEMARQRKRFNDAAISSYPYAPWLEDGHLYFGNPEAKGKALFLAYVMTKKPWDFDLTQVYVGGYHLKKNDILTPSWTNPFGELPSDLEGWFAFVVPKSEVKAGQTVRLGYGNYGVDWKAPK